MGPQPLPRNSTLGPSVRPGSRSQDGARSEPASGGAFFAGGSHDRFVVGQKPGRKVPSLGKSYSLSACWPGEGPRNARRRGGPRPVRPFDWEGLFSVPPDRGWTRVGVSPLCLQGLWPVGRLPIRPVLKHGPRSLTCARVMGLYET